MMEVILSEDSFHPFVGLALLSQIQNQIAAQLAWDRTEIRDNTLMTSTIFVSQEEDWGGQREELEN